jgi:hypothetical protein
MAMTEFHVSMVNPRSGALHPTGCLGWLGKPDCSLSGREMREHQL